MTTNPRCLISVMVLIAGGLLVTPAAATAAVPLPTVAMTATPNPVEPGANLTLAVNVVDQISPPTGAKVVFCYENPKYQTCDVEQDNEFGETVADAAGLAHIDAVAPAAAGTYDVYATYYGIDTSDGIITGYNSNQVTLVVGAATPVGPILNIADVSLDEGNTLFGHLALFPVTLSTPSAVTVTAKAVAGDGTATHNRDYLAIAFPVRLSAGQLRTYVPVLIIGDRVKEPDETFTITLTSISGAVGGRTTATGTIVNDD